MEYKIKTAELETVCGITSTLPKNTQPEFAFAGKSNVGKSSLINGLMNRKSLARTSSEPGKTQTINFYHVNNEFYLVDLPGYGYAKRARTEVEKWGKMIEKYLHTSKALKQVFLLIDIRHAPGANDIQMYEWILSQGYEPVIIATKADKLSKNQLPKAVKLIRQTLGMSSEQKLIPYSALSKAGREDIYQLLVDLAPELAQE
ncbi:ribosome biogenesis GTP-binding protein YihA/YsxC [Butyrivibrio sp. MC2013]|uniref:ribosome biogenesis GTP-binding protein YihA/YsxC n=1 Tax=Butyrivibrio sp. MC2013 TaxID=1280686 RepID=UPI0004177FB6|nr:ribosome biogenesis GTP-binding protein YihA/YsxC [Butyrivibrio sp. MC2013]